MQAKITNIGNYNMTLTDDHKLGELQNINNATAGTVTIFNKAVEPRTATAVDQALDGITKYNGKITFTGNHTIDN